MQYVLSQTQLMCTYAAQIANLAASAKNSRSKNTSGVNYYNNLPELDHSGSIDIMDFAGKLAKD